jgi:Na+/proline symporter
MFAARDERTAFIAVGGAAALVFALYACAVVIAVAARAGLPPLADPQQAVPSALMAWAPVGLRGLGYAVLFAIVVTTMSSIWNTWVAMALADFGRTGDLGASRRLTLAVALASWLLGNLLVDDILDKMILANIPIAALAFGLLGGLYWRRASTAGAWAAAAVGAGAALGLYLTLGDAGLYTWWWAVAGIPASFAVGVGASLAWPDRDPSRAEAFYARVGAPRW